MKENLILKWLIQKIENGQIQVGHTDSFFITELFVSDLKESLKLLEEYKLTPSNNN